MFDLDVARIEKQREKRRERGGESGTEKREIQTAEIISRVVWDGLIKIVNQSTASGERERSRGEVVMNFFTRCHVTRISATIVLVSHNSRHHLLTMIVERREIINSR